MSHSTTTARSAAFSTTAQGSVAPSAATDDTADLAADVPRHHRATRVLALVLLGVMVVVGASTWALAHRSHRPMPATEALPAATEWCAYNFPPPRDTGATDPNLNTYACRLGFLDGAANPDSDSTPEKRRVIGAENKVGATNPQGLWDIAYLAGWTAGHDAARSA